jgi:hypothetical protein
MYYCTSSEPALWWSVYVTLESACDHLRACESRCLSVRGPISTTIILRPRHRQAQADGNILCTEAVPLHPFRTCRTPQLLSF